MLPLFYYTEACVLQAHYNIKLSKKSNRNILTGYSIIISDKTQISSIKLTCQPSL